MGEAQSTIRNTGEIWTCVRHDRKRRKHNAIGIINITDSVSAQTLKLINWIVVGFWLKGKEGILGPENISQARSSVCREDR
eukprot:9259960-Heterocapsa_arctica.AAC.1